MNEIDATGPDKAQIEASLARVRRFASLLDSRYRIPATSIRFGLGPLIGLVPVVGDIAGLLMSGYVLLEARRVQVPTSLQLRMLGNAVLDALGGMIPIVGDIFDVWFKANDRNVALMTLYLEQQLAPPANKYSLAWPMLILAGLILVAFGIYQLR